MEQEEKLRTEMKQDAERKAQRTLDRARREARKLLDAARVENDARRKERLAAAEMTAGEKERAILAGIEYEQRRRELRIREAVVEKVLEDACRKALDLDGDTRLDALRKLLFEALEAMGVREGVVRCAVADEKLVRHLLETEKLQMTVRADPAIQGGLVVEDKADRRFYDNTFASRLARLRDELRATAFAVMKPKPEEQKPPA